MAILKTPKDTDLFPIGEHKGKAYANVPASYLKWFNEQPWSNNWPYIKLYIKENWNAISIEKTEPDDLHNS